MVVFECPVLCVTIAAMQHDIETLTTDEYDSPWKDMLEHAFPEFMAYYFPALYAQIDWSQGFEFKNTELRQVVRDAELGRRFADCLVRVTLKSGGDRWIYIHVEVQGQRDGSLPKRVFTYNYRIYDRFDCPVASLVILADDDPGWKPGHFGFEVFGCRLSLTFPVVKLTELAPSLEQLERDANPFAIVTAAHLRTRQTKNNPQERYQAKRMLVRLLYTHGWDRQRILDLFAVLDWMMRLPDGLEQKLWQDVEQIEGEKRMRYVTSIERLATERGMQQGMQQGIQQGVQQGESSLLLRLLTRRFGALPEWVTVQLNQAGTDLLETWFDRALEYAGTVALHPRLGQAAHPGFVRRARLDDAPA